MSTSDDAYVSIATALLDIKARMDVTEDAKEKAALDTAYSALTLSLGDIALQDYKQAADKVTQASLELQNVVDFNQSASLENATNVIRVLAGDAPVENPAGKAPIEDPADVVPKQDPPKPVGPPPTSPQMNEAGFSLLRKWEGCVLYAYDDANQRRVMPGQPVLGTLTIGYGHTGGDVYAGLICSQQRAETMLQTDVADISKHVRPMLTTSLSSNQFSAFVCFAFNIGLGGFSKSSALKAANGGRFNDVPSRIALWNKTTIAGQLVVSQGLANRRSAEIDLWNRQG
ncbi:lysozyme [Mesorhizobium sp. B2-4-15]|uniref:lysozyme n=1 Tax=Mesorhizobium sp. B2-4-15 TaxID=2589934 RepID=UPI001153815B|nr:lysozyme [Mesorhizobium sp. B2-4-15]TPK73118.1 lysozyme [Mesorhizobium sp. B2-4-15]